MAFGGSKLGIAKPGLLLNQGARHPHVPGHERTKSQFQIVQHPLMKSFQFPHSLDGELVSVLDLLASELHTMSSSATRLIDAEAPPQIHRTPVAIPTRVTTPCCPPLL